MNPDTHYSLKSPLYKMETDNDGESMMERVPVGEVLLKKIAEYSPKAAMAIALATAKPEAKYSR